MKNKKLFILSILICFIPIILSLIFYQELPNQVPIHWNSAGEINGYAPKPIALLVLPFALILLHIYVVWVLNNDPKHQNIPNIMATLLYFLIPCTSILINVFTLTVLLNANFDIKINTIMSIVMGALFLVIGNYLPKCKQSYTVGIKTPWTLDDETIWNKTHRMGGFLWILGGIFIMFNVFIPIEVSSGYMIFIVAIMVLIPYFYSYLLFKRKKDK